MLHFLIKILELILACSILILIYAVYYFYRSLKPSRFITPVSPDHYGLVWEKVSLRTEDGLLIRGWFIPPPVVSPTGCDEVGSASGGTTGGGMIPGVHSKRAMIVCHGYPFDKGNVLPLAKFLHSEYALLLFDFRAMGESEGNLTTVGYKEVLDLKAALDYLEKKGIQKIGVLGFSLGASVGLLAAEDPRIKAIVADSPFASMDKLLDEIFKNLFFLKKILKFLLIQLGKFFLKIKLEQISPERVIRKVQTPIFVIHGDEDTQVHLSHAIQLKEANPGIQLWIVPNSSHGEAHELYPVEYERRVKTFLNEHLTNRTSHEKK